MTLLLSSSSVEALLSAEGCDATTLGAIFSVFGLAFWESPPKLPPAARPLIEEPAVTGMKRVFNLAGEADTRQITDVVSSVMKAGALAGDSDLSLSCGMGLLLHMLLYPHPSASEPAEAAGMFSAALALYQKVVPAPLLADWWVETCGEVDATSVRVCEIQTLCIDTRFAASTVQ